MLKKVHKIILIIIIVWMGINLALPPVYAQESPNTIDFEKLDSYLSQQVKENRIPGLAVAVIQENEILFSKGYGEAHPGVPVTPQTQFYLGSITKSFTALAAMNLVQEGKLDLDKPVQDYLPWFKVADEVASQTITTRQLLNHTSGLSATQDPNVDVYTDTLKEQAQYLQYVQPVAKPGTQYEYYNQNYRLVGCLIEEISGVSYEEYLTQHIFIPMEMKNTVTTPEKAGELAQGYARMLGLPVAMEQEYNPGALPSGYTISTAEDMAKYLIVHLNNTVNESTYLDSALMDQLHNPPVNIDSSYAMGWLKDGNKIGHGGSLHTYQSFMMLDTDTRTGFIMLINQNSMQNMLAENASIQSGIESILEGNSPETKNYRWIGWLLSGLILLDLVNHIRLFTRFMRTDHKSSKNRTPWQWITTILGVLLPTAILLGLPSLIHHLDGGAPNWYEPFRLMPDITLWLLVGTSLTLARNLTKLLMPRKNIK